MTSASASSTHGSVVEEIGRVREPAQLRFHRRSPLRVAAAEDVDAYAACKVQIFLAVRVEEASVLAAHDVHGKARVGGREVQLVPFFRRHISSPDTNIVPIPSSVRVSMRMECGTLPSMMNTFFTPRRMASTQQLTLGIIPTES